MSRLARTDHGSRPKIIVDALAAISVPSMQASVLEEFINLRAIPAADIVKNLDVFGHAKGPTRGLHLK
jgi:hypothetical protein